MKNVSLLGILLLMIVVGFAQEPKKEGKPNIIFILVDDLGYGDLGVFYQNLRKKQQDKSKPFHFTPSLDKMARQGAVLTNQYCNAPVCAPSRASFLTGMNQGNAHIRDNQFDKALEDNYTIANVLKHAGYATAAIGKWGLQGEKGTEPNWPAHPLKRGFDYYYGYMRHADGHEHYPFEGIYRGKKQVWENNDEVSKLLAKCYTTDLWTASAKRWIQQHEEGMDANVPFFMYLAYDAPHAVLELPTQAYPEGGGLNGGIQWLGNAGNMINTASGRPDSFVHPDYAGAVYDDDNDPATSDVPWPETYKRYATAVRRLDDGIGDILKLLEDLHIDDNTLIVFSSDNGPSIESYLPGDFVPYKPTFFASYGPFDGIKRDCWEGGLRMPVIALWPNQIRAGSTIDRPSMLSDWLATFADAAGLPSPARADSRSLLSSLKGEKSPIQSNIYVEYAVAGGTPDFKAFEPSRRGKKRGQMQMLRIGDMVGVRYNIQSADDTFEIYNVVKDPKQSKNLAKDNMQSLQKEFKMKALQLHRADTAAPRPYDNDLIPSIVKPEKLSKGLNYKLFAGNFPYLVSELHLTESSKGISAVINGNELKYNGVMLYDGYANVPESGVYEFSFTTNGKGLIRVHETVAIDADFGYQSGEKIIYKVPLEKGFHPIKIYLQKTTGSNSLATKLEWRKEGGEWTALKEVDLYH